ncbi:MAG: DUF459 domain-containing protein [Deltaproteobacteria bacterium]|nr:DUF459 domain-containing protein [Deltaproteobacteria bacterium]
MNPETKNHLFDTLVVGVVAAALAGVASGPTLARWARRKPEGAARTVASRATAPVVALSERLGIARRREALASALFVQALPEFTVSEAEPERRVVSTERANPIAVSQAISQTISQSDERRFSRSRPLLVWVAGDSMAFNFGRQLERLGRASGAVRVALDSQPSTGLIDRGEFRWVDRLRTAIEQRRPHVFVLSFGANDADVLRHHGVLYAPGRPEWREGYRERVRTVIEQIASRRPTYWLGMPVMHSAEYGRKISVMNEVFAEETAHSPNVVFVETWRRYEGPDHEYSAFLSDSSGRMRLVRESDGVHYTPEGARQLAAHVYGMLCARFVVGGCAR